MRRNTHIRRRIKERLGEDAKAIGVITRLVKASHGRSSYYRPGVKSHLVHYNGQRLQAIYDWRAHRLVTVIPRGTTEANDR